MNEIHYTTVGIDGCKGKWIAVALMPDGFRTRLYKSVEEVCKEYPNADEVLIDMAIGLPENQEQEQYRPDALLRNYLKGKASSVFPIPCRQAVYEKDKVAIRRTNVNVLYKSLSAQSIAILPKIREVDEFLDYWVDWKNRLKESHPEAVFSLLNHGKPILENKKETQGIEERLKVLESYYPKTRQMEQNFLNTGWGVGRENDFLDALALAIAGQIGKEQGFFTIPEHPMKDSRGLLMQIVLPVVSKEKA